MLAPPPAFILGGKWWWVMNMFSFLKNIFNPLKRAAKKFQKSDALMRLTVALSESAALFHIIRQHGFPVAFRVTTYSGYVLFCVVNEEKTYDLDVGIRIAGWSRRLGGKKLHFILRICERDDYEELKADPPAGVLVL